jgi:copper(I)-binding protein
MKLKINFKRIIMSLRSPLILFAALLISASINAHEYNLGELRIQHPYARTTVAGQPSGGAYLTLENTGKSVDTLVSASSPVAKAVELHIVAMDGEVMKMREVPGIELKPAAKIAMKPGDGYHLMLVGLKQELKAGDKFPLALTFQKAGKVEVSVYVEERDAKSGKDASLQHMH